MMNGPALCLLLVAATLTYVDSNVPTIAKDFVFTFFNADPLIAKDVRLLAFVSNNNNGTANVVVTSPHSSFNTIKVSVAPYSVLKIPIIPNTIQAQYSINRTEYGSIVIEDKGIRLQSDLPVAVYAHAEHSNGVSSDSFLVIPAVQLGMQYMAVTSPFIDIDINFYPNIIAVVAYQDNTQITIGTHTVTINALQVASVASVACMSGRVISGNKPFGAISGCTNAESVLSHSYDAVMLLPVGDWGTQFIAIPFMYQGGGNYYQVVASTNNTIVSAEGTTVAALNAGEYLLFTIGAALLTSNYPVQLIQIGQNIGIGPSYPGNAFFIQVPSTDKMSNTNVLFQPTGFVPRSSSQLVFVLRIVTNLAGTGTIMLDGTTISALQFKRVPDSNFYYYESTTLNTTHSVTTNNPGARYFVISYTYGKIIGCGFICAFDLPSTI